jgi:hypothetical protein
MYSSACVPSVGFPCPGLFFFDQFPTRQQRQAPGTYLEQLCITNYRGQRLRSGSHLSIGVHET